jgi:hypothetical protein
MGNRLLAWHEFAHPGVHGKRHALRERQRVAPVAFARRESRTNCSAAWTIGSIWRRRASPPLASSASQSASSFSSLIA